MHEAKKLVWLTPALPFTLMHPSAGKEVLRSSITRHAEVGDYQRAPGCSFGTATCFSRYVSVWRQERAERKTRAFLEKDLERRLGSPPAPPPVAEGARIRYQVMNTVPENWVPFIPVHREGDNREIQLQRAALPRIPEGDPADPRKVRPRTFLLRTGLDGAGVQAYFVHEEEVPRAGVLVTQGFRRTRWRDGRV